MIKTVVAGALLAVGGAIGAPAVVAHADPFIDYLVRNGEESSTAEMRDAELDLGYAICNLYRATGGNAAVVRGTDPV